MTPEQKQFRIEQIQKRRAHVENGDLDYATSDTGKGYCVGYIYEKATGAEVARMSSLYDVMRGHFFAHAAADIDFLLSLVKSQEAERDPEIERVAIAGIQEGLRQRDEMTAAAMRSACVEKVKAMGMQWYAEAKNRGAAFSDKGRLAEVIAKELESLSIEKQSRSL